MRMELLTPLKNFIQNNPIPIIVLDKVGKVLDYNRALKKLIGFEKNDMREKKFWKIEIFRGQKSDNIHKFFENCIEEGKSELEEIKIKTINSSQIWISLRASKFDFENELLIQVVLKNINERKNIESRLQMVENEITDVIFVLDLNLQHKYLSPSVESLRGYSLEEAMNLSFRENYTPSSQQKVIEMRRKYLTRQKLKDESYNPVITENLEVYRKDGSIIPIEVRMRLIRDKDWRKTKIIGVTREIAERKSAERRYKRLFQTSRDAIMTLEPPTWHFSSGNPTAIEMFGAKNEEDFCSSPPWKYSPKTQPDGQDSIKKANKMIEKAMDKGSNYFEWTHKRLNGNIFPATILLSRIEISGKRFLQATVRDITERKRAEEKLKESRKKLEVLNNQLEVKVKKRTEKLRESQKILKEQNEQLKRLDKIKNDFISMAAHELKTPLASIYGYIDYILSVYPNKVDAEMKQDLEIVQRNVRRLKKYINQLLDVMKIEESKMKLHKNLMNFSELIKNCVNELSYLIKQKNLTLNLNLENDLEPKIDQERIFQVCSNLISNSIKFTPKGGEIWINTYKDNNQIIFEIQDNGIGLNKKQMTSIFKKFEKYEGGIDNYPRGKGTGLGLFISRGIVEAHKGRIWVESEGKGRGSKFSFSIPYEK